VKQNRVRELWKQGKPAVQGWCSTGNSLSSWQNDDRHIAAVQRILAAAQASGIVACHHGAGPAVSAQFIKMGSMLCQIGNEMRMLTAATAEALKTFREALN
jgi:2-keto-3-deoxy-L-rhamnonate aldolase RhmA